jgi:hypothetical protein
MFLFHCFCLLIFSILIFCSERVKFGWTIGIFLDLIPTKGTASTDIGGIGKQKKPERLADGNHRRRMSRQSADVLSAWRGVAAFS